MSDEPRLTEEELARWEAAARVADAIVESGFSAEDYDVQPADVLRLVAEVRRLRAHEFMAAGCECLCHAYLCCDCRLAKAAKP